MSIYKDERQQLSERMWEIVLRETKVDDDAGCDWFTIGDTTYIGGIDWVASENSEIAELVNAINALNGLNEFIDREDICPHRFTRFINDETVLVCNRCGEEL